MPHDLLAATDMRPHLALATAVLAAGVLVLWLNSKSSKSSESPKRSWAPFVALAAGPLVGTAWWMAGLFLLAPNVYVLPADVQASLTAHLLIGTFVGLAVAVVLGLVGVVSNPKRS